MGAKLEFGFEVEGTCLDRRVVRIKKRFREYWRKEAPMVSMNGFRRMNQIVGNMGRGGPPKSVWNREGLGPAIMGPMGHDWAMMIRQDHDGYDLMAWRPGPERPEPYWLGHHIMSSCDVIIWEHLFCFGFSAGAAAPAPPQGRGGPLGS